MLSIFLLFAMGCDGGETPEAPAVEPTPPEARLERGESARAAPRNRRRGPSTVRPRSTPRRRTPAAPPRRGRIGGGCRPPKGLQGSMKSAQMGILDELFELLCKCIAKSGQELYR